MQPSAPVSHPQKPTLTPPISEFLILTVDQLAATERVASAVAPAASPLLACLVPAATVYSLQYCTQLYSIICTTYRIHHTRSKSPLQSPHLPLLHSSPPPFVPRKAASWCSPPTATPHHNQFPPLSKSNSPAHLSSTSDHA
eukprot:GFKZ01007558.1.p1 GENE.GFKZ01007558.1~~GFKZ01007558.1.p1  ORF type:complete len:141 (+),score=3.63 GFKZ01007558.1:131-553(+)